MRKCNDGAGIGVSSDGDIGSVSSIPSNSRQSGNQVNGRADCKIDMALSALGLITVLAREREAKRSRTTRSPVGSATARGRSAWPRRAGAIWT
jgi:hypothetical protein